MVPKSIRDARVCLTRNVEEHWYETHATFIPTLKETSRNRAKRKLKRAGHGACTGVIRNESIIFVRAPKGKVKHGRPKRRWNVKFVKYLRESACECMTIEVVRSNSTT